MVIDPVGRHQRVGPAGQRPGEFRWIERPAVHHDRRHAEFFDQLPVGRPGIDQCGHDRTAIASRPVRVGQGRVPPYQDERQPAHEQGDHHLVKGRARLTGHHCQHREGVAGCHRLPRGLVGALVQHAERRRPGHRLRAAVHTQLRVHAALEILHREGAEAEQYRHLRHAVPGAHHHHELTFPVGQAGLADAGGCHVGALQQRQHGREAMRFGNEGVNARSAGKRQIPRRSVPVDHDHVQPRETLEQIVREHDELAQLRPRVQDHGIRQPQLTQRRQLFRPCDLTHDGKVRPRRQAHSERISKQSSRRLHGNPNGAASGNRSHRFA